MEEKRIREWVRQSEIGKNRGVLGSQVVERKRREAGEGGDSRELPGRKGFGSESKNKGIVAKWDR